jgi:hypothetical protein
MLHHQASSRIHPVIWHHPQANELIRQSHREEEEIHNITAHMGQAAKNFGLSIPNTGWRLTFFLGCNRY